MTVCIGAPQQHSERYNGSMEATQGRFVIPDVVATHFHLRPGDTVADFGAGSGHFLRALSRLVGHEGKVYALEIQRTLVEAAGDLVRRLNLGNVEVVWCDLETAGGTKLRDDALDAGVLVNSLFQFEDRESAMEEIVRTLRPGGKLFIVDWSESWGGMGPALDQVIDERTARALAESRGLVFERSFDAGDHHYGLAFRKP